jgi:rhodanese-related sulfurtransferase
MTMREVTVDQAAALIEAGAALIDVREPAEFRNGHLPGAVNIPMGQVAGRLHEIDRGSPVYVVCAAGNRSGAMTDVLRAHGFNATNVAGGTADWIRSGRPIVR